MSRNKWTVMVYLASDNNLAEEMVYALKSMQLVGSAGPSDTDKHGNRLCEIFALYDGGVGPAALRIKDREFPPVDVQPPQGFLKEVEQKRGPELPKTIDSVQTVLTKFVVDKIESHPAEHYMLVLSGHGSGAVGDFLTGNKRAVGLSIPELREALTAIQAHFQKKTHGGHPYLTDGKIDILGLDSCVMGMVEVAYEVRRYVSYLVGAEGFEPNTGWPYDRILRRLRRDKNHQAWEPPNPASFAKEIATEYINYYSSDYTVADVSTDVSVLDLKQIEHLANALGTKGWSNWLDVNELITREDCEKEGEDERALRQKIAKLVPDHVSKVLADSGVKETTKSVTRGIAQYPETKDYIERFTTGNQLSELVIQSLANLEQDGDLKSHFEGFDELFDCFIEVIKDPETPAAIKTTLAEDSSVSNLVKATLEHPATLDLIVDALQWDDGLSEVLRAALEDKDTCASIKDALVLAHWEAQGFKFEQHIDLLDFCERLSNRCQTIQDVHQTSADASYNPGSQKIANTCRQIIAACDQVKAIEKSLVLHSFYCGPAFQHSRGISIFFPWANRTDSRGVTELQCYSSLEFDAKTQWHEFVSTYHEKTQRPHRKGRDPHLSTLNRYDWLFTVPVEFGVGGIQLNRPLAQALTKSLRKALDKNVGPALSARLGNALSARLGDALSQRLGTALSQRLGNALSQRLGTALSQRLGTALSQRLGTALSQRLGTALSQRLGSEVTGRFTGGGATLKLESMKNPPIKWFS